MHVMSKVFCAVVDFVGLLAELRMKAAGSGGAPDRLLAHDGC